MPDVLRREQLTSDARCAKKGKDGLEVADVSAPETESFDEKLRQENICSDLNATFPEVHFAAPSISCESVSFA